MANEKRQVKSNYRKGGVQNQQPSSDRKFRTKEKEGYINQIGEVVESNGNGTFKVLLDNDMEILATLAGKIRMNYIKIIPGDKVEVQLSVYDLSKGRITRRL